jgi:DNA-binding transcriptional regulator YiaG
MNARYRATPSGESGKAADWDKERIKALRNHLRLTQREMANKLGTRQQTISEWEIGMYQPRGTSATLLSIVAERAKFSYDTAPKKKA